MVASNFNFTVGSSTLPDVGKLYYNGVTFSPLFYSTLSSKIIKDNAGRTTKLLEYTLEVDGYVTAGVTINGGAVSASGIAPIMAALQAQLTQHAGVLVYKGRGFDFSINNGQISVFDSATRDVAWGPVPELMEFQPMGGALSAKVKWRLTFRVVATRRPKQDNGARALNDLGLLQFNCETSVAYSDDYFSTLSIKGTMEIPMTRVTPVTRRVSNTVDDMRGELDTRIFAGIDLSRFRVVRREYNISRDKRTMEFSVEVEEKPYMDMPIGCTAAHGSYNVRPAKAGMGLALWLCTLRISYTVRNDQARRLAWVNFLGLMRLRMIWSNADPLRPNDTGGMTMVPDVGSVLWPNPGQSPVGLHAVNLMSNRQPPRERGNSAFIVDFSIEEGMHQDSKTVSFSATWRLTTTFQRILVTSGIWRRLAIKDDAGSNLWAISMRDVSGSQSWLRNPLNPSLATIVDFGGG